MTMRTVVASLALACMLGGMAEAGESKHSLQDDVAAIENLVARYAQSIDAADTKLASEIWARDDVSFTHPRGHEEGWEAVKRNVYEKLMGETFSERLLIVRDVKVHAYSEAAWAEFSWDFEARLRKDGSKVETHGRESQVYRRIDGFWRIVHVHYSGMPVTDDGQGF